MDRDKIKFYMQGCRLIIDIEDGTPDIYVILYNTETEWYSNILKYDGTIDYDLNSYASGHYIYLGYKTTKNYNEAIKNITIKKGNDNAKDSIDIDKINYKLSPLEGDNTFVSGKGDLNTGAGGKYLYLFYTKNELPSKMAIRSLEINNTKSHSLDTTDLNDGAGGDYIFLHVRRLNSEGYSYVSEIDDADWMSFIPDNVKITNIRIKIIIYKFIIRIFFHYSYSTIVIFMTN